MFQSPKCCCGQRMFLEKRAPRSKYDESGCCKKHCLVWREKPLSSYVTSHSLATRMPHSVCTLNIEEREFWAGWSVWLRWDSRLSRIFSPHTTWPLTSLTSHHSAVQLLLAGQTSSKLRPDRLSAVTTGLPHAPSHVPAGPLTHPTLHSALIRL